MRFRTFAAGATLAAAVVSGVPAVAAADDPGLPRNGIIPAGTYLVGRSPDNFVGSPIEGCRLQVFADGTTVVLVCGTSSQTGRQAAVGTEAHLTFGFAPFGLALHVHEPNPENWVGTVNITGTPIIAPYPLAGVWLKPLG